MNTILDAGVRTAERMLLITRVFESSPARMFEVWTRPEHLVRWWKPRTGLAKGAIHCCDMDVRPGGEYRIGLRSDDGAEAWARGAFREVVEPERLVFTFALECDDGRPGHQTVVTVTFVEHGGKTKLTFRQFMFASVTDRDDQLGGLTECLDRLANYIAPQ